MTKDQLNSNIRTLLKMGGAALVTKGLTTGDQMGSLVNLIMDAIGAIMAIYGIVLSWFHHKSAPPAP